MAIFNHGDNPSSSTGASTTILTDGAAFKGELNIGCDLFIDGAFEGSIRSEKMVTIGKNGRVKGELHASHLLVQGEFEGTVDAAEVEIKSSGRVRGTVAAGEFSIEPKGVFEGESKIKRADAAPADDEA